MLSPSLSLPHWIRVKIDVFTKTENAFRMNIEIRWNAATAQLMIIIRNNIQ